MKLLPFLTGTLATATAIATPLSTLTHSLSQTSSLRAIKDLTSTFAHLSQLHAYPSIAALFTPTGTLLWGNTSYSGASAITSFLANDLTSPNSSGKGVFDTFVLATPLVNLAPDGTTAKGRYNGWRFQGDGKGGTRLEGGIWENEYRLVGVGVEGKGKEWRIERMRHFPLYEGAYEGGWRNYGGRDFGAVPPFHYTPDEAGVPIPSGGGEEKGEGSWEEVKRRVEVLNDEDAVKNLQHSYGYYLDRRMWNDVEDLFGDGGKWGGVFTVDNVGSWSGPGGVRKALEKWMGPKGLSRGVLNEHLLFNTMVSVRNPGVGGEVFADARGIEVALIGDAAKNKSQWRIGFFQNTFVKHNGTWQFLNVTIAPLIVANYSTGWGKGSILPASTITPQLLPLTHPPIAPLSPSNTTTTPTTTEITSFDSKLRRSIAYDGAENIINAYGFYIDYIDGAGCFNMSAIHHTLGHKESPFTGFYHTQKRVLDACTASYGTASQASRSSISFHWRPQPVILVSEDGRSASVRARLLQPATAKGADSAQIRGGMYHDQAVLDASGIWRLWSVTIDEFYWNSGRWSTGWGGVAARAANASNPGPRDLTKQFPPDLVLTEMGERERGFQGGTGRYTAWPDIQKMWFMYRNLVSGRVPESDHDGYWPGCVPCQHRPEWALEKNGWQEPPTGPVR